MEEPTSDESPVSYEKDHKIDLQQLTRLKVLFEAIDKNGKGELDEEEFVQALAPILSKNMNERELQQLFLRVDANANGSVDWDEFSSYILLSGEHKMHEDTVKAQYVKGSSGAQHSAVSRNTVFRDPDHHFGVASCLLCNPRSGKYYTCGRDGLVKSWGPNAQLEQTIHVGNSWITDAVFMKNDTRLATCSMDKVVSVFDLGSHGGELWKSFVGKKHAWGKEERTLTNLSDDTQNSSKIMSTNSKAVISSSLLGGLDTYQKEIKRVSAQRTRDKQYVELSILHNLQDYPMSIASWNNYMCLGLKNGYLQLYDPNATMDGNSNIVPCEASFHLHSAPISKVKVSKYVDGVITAGWDHLIKIISLERGKVTRVLGDVAYQKSIFALEWSETHRLLASAGAERHIYLWNPYISKPVYRLDGHCQPLVNLCFNNSMQQLLSLSTDKAIKVWDLRTMRCLQTLTNDDICKIEDPINTIAFDCFRGTLVCASSYPCVYPIKSSLTRFAPEPIYTGHHSEVIHCVYNPHFNQIISCDVSRILVWDLLTGTRLSSFNPSHCTRKENVSMSDPISLMDSNQIATLDIDENGRRLIVATHGGIFTFNHANGQLLKQLVLRQQNGNAIPVVKGKEISYASYIWDKEKLSRHIVAAVGNTIVVWSDTPNNNSKERCLHYLNIFSVFTEVVTTTTTPGKKKADLPSIMSICPMHGGLVALGTDRAVVLLYNLSRNELMCQHIGTVQQGVTVDDLVFKPDREALFVVIESMLIVWSLKLKTTLFRLDHAVRVSSKAIHAVSVSPGCKYIITGDDSGMVFVWSSEVKAFYSSSDPFDDQMTNGISDSGKGFVSRPPAISSTPHVLLSTYFHAQQCAIVSVKYTKLPEFGAVVSCSTDCQVRLHDLTGICIGFFGQENNWALDNKSTWATTVPVVDFTTKFAATGGATRPCASKLGWIVEALDGHGLSGKVRATLRVLLRQTRSRIKERRDRAEEINSVCAKSSLPKPRVLMKRQLPTDSRLTVERLKTPMIPSRCSTDFDYRHLKDGRESPRLEIKEGSLVGGVLPQLCTLDGDKDHSNTCRGGISPRPPSEVKSAHQKSRGVLHSGGVSQTKSRPITTVAPPEGVGRSARQVVERVHHRHYKDDWALRATAKLKCSKLHNVSPPRLRHINENNNELIIVQQSID